MTNLTEFQARVLKDINLKDFNHRLGFAGSVYIYLNNVNIYIQSRFCWCQYVAGVSKITVIHENDARKLLFDYLKFKNFL